VQDHTRLLTPSPDPGPEDAGEELKRKQAVPDGLNPELDEEKARERTRLDPDTGETLLPESVEERHEEQFEAFRRARSGGMKLREGDEGFSRAEETERLLTEQWRDNPAMLGVGRTVEEEPVILVRAADAPAEAVDPAKKWNPNPGGGPGVGAPPAIPAGPGERHHVGAAWPAPLTPSAAAPSASPEPGPEPSHPDPSRNSAGKIKHSFVADKMIETGLAAFGGDAPDHGTLQQALLYAQRRLRANWRTYMAERNGRQEKPQEPELEQQPAGA